MQSHHTITIRIPTRALLLAGAGLLAGLAVGLVLIGIHAAGIELLTPFVGLPMLAARPAAEPASAAPVPAEQPADNVTSLHPAVMHWNRTPAHVRDALDHMVDRVLAEKARAA